MLFEWNLVIYCFAEIPVKSKIPSPIINEIEYIKTFLYIIHIIIIIIMKQHNFLFIYAIITKQCVVNLWLFPMCIFFLLLISRCFPIFLKIYMFHFLNSKYTYRNRFSHQYLSYDKNYMVLTHMCKCKIALHFLYKNNKRLRSRCNDGSKFKNVPKWQKHVIPLCCLVNSTIFNNFPPSKIGKWRKNLLEVSKKSEDHLKKDSLNIPFSYKQSLFLKGAVLIYRARSGIAFFIL